MEEKENRLSPAAIAGYLLSGGENRRMGGKKKLFLEYEGTPFYRRILTGMSALTAVYLSVDIPEPYIGAGLPLIADKYPRTGPLGAICTGLELCPQEALLAAACDMPFLDGKLVERLTEEYRKYRGIVITEKDGRCFPFPGIYPKEVLPVFLEQLLEGRWKMMEAIE